MEGIAEALTSVASGRAEAIEYASRLARKLDETERALSRAHTDAARRRLAEQTHRAVAPFLEAMFEQARIAIMCAKLVLRVATDLDVPSREWQLMLLALDGHRDLLDRQRRRLRRLAGSLPGKRHIMSVLWPARWEETCEHRVEALEDLVETFALGLHETFHDEVERRRSA